MRDDNSEWFEDVDDSDNTINYDEVPFYEESIPRPSYFRKPLKKLFDNPRSIYNYLDSCVYGHREFKRALAFFVWQIKHGHRPSALLIAGNSGEGKTETIRALQKVYRNMAVADGASITPQGYKGNNKLASAMNLLDMNDPAHPPIYVIDEADKLICRQGWGEADLTGELLKLMEDGVLDISGNEREQRFVSTENVSFILLGSFSHLTDQVSSNPVGFNVSIGSTASPRRKPLTIEMIRDTLSPELQGRIGDIIVLEPFKQADFEHILKDERYSPIRHFEKEYNLHINIKPGKREEIAASAYINQTGVRSMTTEIARYLKDSLFDDPETKEICI